MSLLSPLTLALAGLLAYRTYHGQGRLADMLGRTGPGGNPTGPGGTPAGMAATNGGLLGSLGGLLGGAGAGTALSNGISDLIKSFQQTGHGETAQSWVAKGPNQPIAPTELEKALGPEKIEWLTKQTGMTREELLAGLSRELPAAVDQLTPDGRLPSAQEASRLVGAERAPI
jgi:uncharacterized protein YidB (DUF937 family)